MNRIKGIINQVIPAAIFMAGVVACYQGALLQVGWLGPSVVGLIIFFDLYKNPRLLKPKLWLLLYIGVAGLILETMLILSGVYSVPASSRWLMPSPLVPLWIAALWLNYAVRVPGYLVMFRGKHILNFIIGFIFALLIFRSAARLDLIEPGFGWWSFIVIGIFWGVFIITIYILADRLFRFLFQQKNN